MLPKGQYFTDAELLAIAFSSPIAKKAKTMQKPTHTGDSAVIPFYKVNRSVEIQAIRQASNLPSIIILPSHLTESNLHLAAGKGVTKAFLTKVVTINGNVVEFADLLQELSLRPTVIEQITIAHDPCFDVSPDNILKLSIINESLFCKNEVREIIGVATEATEDGSFAYVFDCYNPEKPVITNGSTKITLDGIGEAETLNIKLEFGISHGIF